MAEIKVYTTSTCPWCTVVKDFLAKHDQEFTEVDVGTDQRAATEMVAKSGQMGVPQIEIDGKIIVGFDEPAIREALNMN
jgi:glutaredoxin-like YruB-family protein